MYHPCLTASQKPVNLGSTDFQHPTSQFLAESPVFFLIVGKPLRQKCNEPFTARLLGDFPDLPQNLFHFGIITGGTALARAGIASPTRLRSQQLNGVLAAVTPLLAEFVNEA